MTVVVVRVQCTFVVPVEVELDHFGSSTEQEALEHLPFFIEENGCPGTSSVGAELTAVMNAAEASHTCWACTLGGANKIISVDKKVTT